MATYNPYGPCQTNEGAQAPRGVELGPSFPASEKGDYVPAMKAFTFRFTPPKSWIYSPRNKMELDRDTLQNADLPDDVNYLELYLLAPYGEVVGGCIVFEQHVTKRACLDVLQETLWCCGSHGVGWQLEYYALPKPGKHPPWQNVNAGCSVHDEVYVYERDADGDEIVAALQEFRGDFIWPGDGSVVSNHVMPQETKMLFHKV